MVFENYYTKLKRYKLEDDFDLICPSCFYKGNLSKKYKLGVNYQIICPNCKIDVGFIKGNVKARKLGSYIRILDAENNQLSIDIKKFDRDFDVRKDDLVTLVYYLKFTDRTPVLIMNQTVKECYNFEFIHIKGNDKSKMDLLEHKKRRNNFMLGHKKIPDINNYDIYEDLPKLDFVNINTSWFP